ncbi:hypothetical protein GTY68_27600 [Streptomyces sp. SID4926]|nr:hypothetical protein [Streptomyces sp. SID4926]
MAAHYRDTTRNTSGPHPSGGAEGRGPDEEAGGSSPSLRGRLGMGGVGDPGRGRRPRARASYR